MSITFHQVLRDLTLAVPVMNSSTRKSIKLPYDNTNEDFPKRRFHRLSYKYRIAYDYNTNEDYKVVRIGVLYGRRKIVEYEFKVYSLRQNSWRRLDKFAHYPNWKSIRDSIVGGALHWISSKEDLLVVFDLGTEIYRIIPQPKYRGSYDYIYLDNLEGCLSLSYHYELSTVDLFLLKKYGGKNEHWLRPTNFFNKIYSPVKPIFYSKSDKQVVIALGGSRLILYNLEEKSVEEVMTHGVLGSGLIDLHI
ncbi:F-box protein CPR1-like [Impatiens glandulifera]|uniref:F-box protein CPR1-like n=1 Tax=Impatiens glandulifera TaxID=253017 RepID=UPI001FB09E3A|nr:F-box protein CPR1-like [Impatiens glandulifera]